MNDHDLISRLHATGRATLDPTRADAIRTTLKAEYDRVTFAAPHRSIQQKRFYLFIPKPMIVAAIASIIIALGLGTTTMANAAKPGDALFGWDQATERVRLALTIGDEAKAKYEAQIAEERLQEQLELEAKQSDFAAEAAAKAGTALDQAILTVGETRLKLEGRPGNGAAALTKVEERLRELRTRHESSDTKLQVEAETKNGKTTVHVEYQQSRWEWTTTVTEREALINEIATRTGLPASDIRIALKLEVETEDDNDSETNTSNTNSNRNTNTTPSSTNRNTNEKNDDGNDDSRNTNSVTNRSTTSNTNESDDDQVIRVRVSLDDGTTEIRATVNGREQEWELNSVIQADIVASIVAKTGLTSTAITSSWDYEQK